MKAKKIFNKMVKAHNYGDEATYISTYENVRQVAKMICSLPDVCIASINIDPPDWEGYDKAYILTYDVDNAIWCQRAYFDDGRIARTSGMCFIDISAIGENKPEDFIIEGDAEIKIVGGENNV